MAWRSRSVVCLHGRRRSRSASPIRSSVGDGGAGRRDPRPAPLGGHRLLAGSRPAVSHGVARFLLARGYDVVPVNPSVREVLGRPCHPSLRERAGAGRRRRRVRRSEYAGRHVDEAIAVGAQAVWLQLGVIDHAAAARARAAGLLVAMDRCPAIELGGG